MKPRLETAEYTAEDTRIHLRHFHACADLARFGGTLFGIGRVQDCRDADLMLHLRVAYGDVSADERRQSHRYRRVCHCAWAFTNLPYGPMP